jgi:hypothetical protein
MIAIGSCDVLCSCVLCTFVVLPTSRYNFLVLLGLLYSWVVCIDTSSAVGSVFVFAHALPFKRLTLATYFMVVPTVGFPSMWCAVLRFDRLRIEAS